MAGKIGGDARADHLLYAGIHFRDGIAQRKRIVARLVAHGKRRAERGCDLGAGHPREIHGKRLDLLQQVIGEV